MKEIVKAFQAAKRIDEVDFMVFFRVSDEYVALFDDAHIINGKIGIPILVKKFTDGQVPYLVIKEDHLVAVLQQLGNQGVENYKIIETQEFDL